MTPSEKRKDHRLLVVDGLLNLEQMLREHLCQWLPQECATAFKSTFDQASKRVKGLTITDYNRR
jgi:hypothetical protein